MAFIRYGIYITLLQKHGLKYGVKIGISRNPVERANTRNNRSFGYAESYGEPDIFPVDRATAKEIEGYIKQFFRRFRVINDENTIEIFCTIVYENIRWAVAQSLAYPEGMKETCWRAANSSLSMSSPLEVSLFNSALTEWDNRITTSVTSCHINNILHARCLPILYPSPALDSGYAVSINVSVTPDHIKVTYVFEFDIDAAYENNRPPVWLPNDYPGIKGLIFIPNAELNIDWLLSQPIKSPGIYEFAIKFTEISDIKSGNRSRWVRNISGRRLPHEVEEEFLGAVFTEDSSQYGY